jgi:hypothetical protein
MLGAATGKDSALTELCIRDYVIASVIVKEGTLGMNLFRIMWVRGGSSWGSPRYYFGDRCIFGLERLLLNLTRTGLYSSAFFLRQCAEVR